MKEDENLLTWHRKMYATNESSVKMQSACTLQYMYSTQRYKQRVKVESLQTDMHNQVHVLVNSSTILSFYGSVNQSLIQAQNTQTRNLFTVDWNKSKP